MKLRFIIRFQIQKGTNLIAFLLVLCGLFSLIIYYETVERDTSDPFESFMDMGRLGVRALFATLGVVISFFWEYLYYSE